MAVIRWCALGVMMLGYAGIFLGLDLRLAVLMLVAGAAGGLWADRHRRSALPARHTWPTIGRDVSMLRPRVTDEEARRIRERFVALGAYPRPADEPPYLVNRPPWVAPSIPTQIRAPRLHLRTWWRS